MFPSFSPQPLLSVQSMGSSPLKDRSLSFSWSRPFSFVAEAYKDLDLISPLYSPDFKVLKDFSFPGLSQKQRGIKDYSNKQKGL
ncbi:MAG: hypothetical protein ACE5IH_10850, partial [Thermodesulfobacteriota bacterium]